MRYLAMALLLAAASGVLLGGSSAADNADGKWGTVKGQVVFGGAVVPQPVELNVNKDQQACLANGPILSEEWVINKDNKGVRWVFVWLAPEKDGPPLVIHPSLKDIKQKDVVMDQPCCKFEPHAVALRKGQNLIAKNSAAIAHNTHWQGHPLHNKGGNVIVPAKGEYTIDNLVAQPLPLQVSCDIHGWMKAWILVRDHPYMAVTDENGKFEIKLAPAGEYRLGMWQEAVGWGPGGREGTKITIQPGGDTDLGQIKLEPRKN
jgi:hypothetical protein